MGNAYGIRNHSRRSRNARRIRLRRNQDRERTDLRASNLVRKDSPVRLVDELVRFDGSIRYPVLRTVSVRIFEFLARSKLKLEFGLASTSPLSSKLLLQRRDSF